MGSNRPRDEARKRGQPLLLYTAYLDEADTHGPAPTIIMAGVLGTTRQWVIFSRRLHRLQTSYGFSVFHTSEFKSRSGEFRGWSNAKRYQLVEELTVLVLSVVRVFGTASLVKIKGGSGASGW